MVKELSSRDERPLRWIIMENVMSITYNRKSGNALEEINQWWSENMSHWEPLAVWRVNAVECLLPQSRTRVFLVSQERQYSDMVSGMPSGPAVCFDEEIKLLEPFLVDHRDVHPDPQS